MIVICDVTCIHEAQNSECSCNVSPICCSLNDVITIIMHLYHTHPSLFSSDNWYQHAVIILDYQYFNYYFQHVEEQQNFSG